MALVGRIAERLCAMPEGNATRERNSRYLDPWYDAVTYGRDFATSTLNLVTQDNLDDLGNFADILAARAGDSGEAVPDEVMSKFRTSIAEWRDLLDEASLPNDVRDQINGQVDHIEWLLDNVSTLGPGPLITRSQQLVGIGVTALVRVPRLADRFGVAIVAITTALTLLGGATREGNIVLDQLTVMTSHIVEIVHGGPRQIEQGRPKRELHAANGNGSSGEVVDGEVVGG